MESNIESNGIKEYIQQRLLEARSAADLQRIKEELEAEGQNSSSIRVVISELRRKGFLKFDDRIELTKIGSKDIIPPEVALRNIRLQDGDYKAGFVDGMQVMIMAARYNQLLAASQAEVLSNQLKIMEESRKGSVDMAREAAMEAAAETARLVTSHLDQMRPVVEKKASPIEEVIARMMETCLNNLMSKLFPQSSGAAPPGFTRETIKGA